MKFELHVADNDVSGGSITVSWCLDREALDYLKKLDIKNPVVVLCVAPAEDNAYDLKKEIRKVVPLKDLIAYVEFQRAGKNNIWGFVCEEMKGAKNKWLAIDGGKFCSDILRHSGDNYREDRYALSSYAPYYGSDKKYLYGNIGDARYNINESLSNYEELKSKFLCSEPVSVDVPKECFAPEPSDFEKAWVNHFFDTKAIDQCNFRRRRIFAYSLQPFIMVINIALRIICLFIAALLGSRTCSFKPILHPLSTSYTDAVVMFVMEKGTIFIKKPTKQDTYGCPIHQWSDFIALPFMPLVILLFCSILFLLLKIAKLVLIVTLAVGFIFVSVFLGLYIYKLIELRLEKLIPWYADEPDVIVCGELKPRKLSNLPAKYKTVRLYYSDIKSRVCRPFSS